MEGVKADISALIGNTPLIQIPTAAGSGRVLAKAEYMNPGGSVKDRPALAIVRAALREGILPGRELLDATSGNTGIAYAMLGSALGFRVTLCLPASASNERKAILRAYGATVIETDPMQGSDGAIAVAAKLRAAEPERFWHADQYSNPNNWKSHFETTGPEIWEQTGGQVTHFAALLGTTGTLTGTGKYLGPKGVKIVAVQPDAPLHGLEGTKHLPTCKVPAIYDPSVQDAMMEVSTEEAVDACRDLARNAGLLVGVSSGGNVAAARRIAETKPDALVVTVLCDSGERYLSRPFWQEDA